MPWLPGRELPVRLLNMNENDRKVPDGPWPAGQAWYPMLGQWGPIGQVGIPDDLDFDPFFEEEAPLAPHLWKTKEGKILQIRDLELSHLRNIIRMIERGILSTRERTGAGPRTLSERADTDERVKNLLNEWLRRF